MIPSESQLQEILVESLKEGAEQALAYIESNWISDTGRSKSGWFYELIGTKVSIKNHEDYAKFVHRKGDHNPLIEELLPEATRILKETSGKAFKLKYKELSNGR